MSLTSVVHDRLTAHAGLTALVGTRTYGGHQLAQDVTYPCVGFGIVSETVDHCMGVDSPLTHARVQLTAYALGYHEARTIATQVRAALDRWTASSGGTVVQDTLREDGSGFDVFDEDLGNEGAWRVVDDFMVHGTGFG